jgi:hypothetical protein
MIDIFTHILTPKYLEALDYTRSGKEKYSERTPGKFLNFLSNGATQQ